MTYFYIYLGIGILLALYDEWAMCELRKSPLWDLVGGMPTVTPGRRFVNALVLTFLWPIIMIRKAVG